MSAGLFDCCGVAASLPVNVATPVVVLTLVLLELRSLSATMLSPALAQPAKPGSRHQAAPSFPPNGLFIAYCLTMVRVATPRAQHPTCSIERPIPTLTKLRLNSCGFCALADIRLLFSRVIFKPVFLFRPPASRLSLRVTEWDYRSRRPWGTEQT